MKASIRKAALFAALAAITATAWATTEPSTQESVTVEALRLDARIQADAIEAVLNVPGISGKIGVESKDAVVTLSGYTTTSGMAMRAARAAGKVSGVRYVQNEIRPLLGPAS